MKKLKILQVSNHYWPCFGGIERFVMDLNNILSRHNVQSDVCCLDRDFQGKKLPQAEKVGKSMVYRIPFVDLKYYKIAPKIIGIVKEYDVIHVHSIGFFSDFLALTQPLHKKPLILSTHGGIFHSSRHGLMKKAYFNTLHRHFLGSYSRIFADSKSDFEIFSEITKNIELAPNGIDFREFKNAKSAKKKNQFIHAGRFAANKQLEKLVEAFAKVAEKRKDFKVILAGSDSHDKSLEKVREKIFEKGIGENFEIVLEAGEEKMRRLNAESSFALNSARHEGFGLSVIESMALGTVPVVNRLEVFAEFIEGNKSGFFVDFNNPEKAAAEILKLMQKSEKQLSKNRTLAKKAAGKFDFEKSVFKMIKAYENAARAV